MTQSETSADEASPSARLICTDATQVEGDPVEQVLLMDEQELSFGRDEACSVHLKSRKLSRKHARLYQEGGQWCVEDLQSTNGVFVNEQRVGKAVLGHGDIVKFGPVPFRFLIEQTAPGPAAAGEATMLQSSDDEDASERTMAFGTQGATKAVLRSIQHREQAGPEAFRPVSARQERRQAEAQPKKASGGRGKWLLIGALVLAVGGGIGAYLYLDAQTADVRSLVDEARPVTKRAVDYARGVKPTERLTADYANDARRLAELTLRTERLLQAHAASADLYDLLGSTAFLAFEREFVPLFAADRLNEAEKVGGAFDARMQKIVAGMPESVDRHLTPHLNAAIELAKLSQGLLNFRGFSQAYPEISPGQQPPPVTLELLLETKRRFVNAKRSHNKLLSVEYILFGNLLGLVEARDIQLFDGWREYARLN